ncbi:D-3-phosphoglycerate dehydrogenase [Winogradskyella eximia]|jgi:D-3-phosphoglycerate dehydrogenase / 2-oxoglutarate reductase|uniref:D-3-phosphoglycerate dehydrogenase n=1 Tax=Winogradskyella eximia TaxID=262006 RepID=A0A3D9H797_9FLAO|nr:D-2-hydroxyacid dehydrogenase [Winogradskyella eximia]RED45377.1 D-3-phosphoglycerate dehydrogenase [Winogradskyella eximia]|tara:strand:+ start:3216 stop:4166 length:951 start_codon:yes stop_codon:yes gene_type:complete
MKVLANDGVSQSGINALEAAGYEVLTTTVAQEQLENYINDKNIDVLLVRSATTVRKDLIDNCPSLKIIGRGGVGMDNIDVDYARSKGLSVINTPAASSHSVAELVFGHFYGLARYLHNSNRDMPLEGDSKFKNLKKAYAKGTELKGKTLGVLGFGRIGQATAKVALGAGMKVVAFDPFLEKADLQLDFFDGQKVNFEIKTISKEEVLKQSDFLTLHVPAQKDYVIDEAEFNQMKDGVIIANAARGGVVNEVALVKAIESGKVSRAALDVFEKEPQPEIQLLMNPALSLTPHTGAATNEAQDRIGTELAEQIISILG